MTPITSTIGQPEALAREQLLAGVPATTRTLEIDGVATTVIVAGEGPPLLLLHGGSSAAL